jgi:pSer/pThr/pTyr-binding forkhead associated (FHA) protein
MKLIIEDDEGRKTVVPVVREEITIGRQDGNTIRLTERNVSRRHARLVKDNGSLLIEDLGSYNGVRVNGEKIAGPTKIKEGDLVEIGDYDLGIQGKLDAPTPPGTSKTATLPPGALKAPAVAKPASAPAQSAPQPQTAAPPEPPPPAPSPQPAPQQQSPSASAGGATAIIRVSDIMKGAPQGGEVRDLQRAEMPRLVGLAGPFRGKELYLMKSEVKFGRTDENDISLDHQSVSRQHGRFVLDQGQWKVIDNKSANGVRVNGEEYAVSNVKAGDTLELGHLKFRFCAPGEKFTPPAEKSDESQKSGGLKPTTAELIAGASQPGRGIPGQQGAAKKGLPLALIGGIVVGVVVLAVVAYLVLGRGKRGDEGGDADDKVSGSAAVKAGDAAFKKKEFIKAGELYEKASVSGETVPNRKRAAEEAKGEALYHQLRSSLDSGDGDKAKNIFDKCSSESSFYCQKVQEMAEAVKASYAKKHLAAANAAKTAGKLDACQAEVNNVLAFDSANAEAQSLASQCGPQEAAKAEAPKHEGPSPKEREAKAAKLATDCSNKLNPAAPDFSGAVKSAQSALALNPSDRNTLGQAYRCLGYGYAYLKDHAAAVKWLEKYLPYCTNDCAQVHAFIQH